MRHLRDALRALLTTLRNLFRPTVTVQFPEQIRPRPERYRTSFALLHDEHQEELCIGCLQCERICPSQVITIKQAPKRESKVTGKKRGWAEDFVLDTSACIFCELCVQVCPTDAIIMTQAPDAPTYTREDLVLTMDRLYAHEQLKPPSWGNGTRLMAMQEAPKEEKKPKPAKPAPAPVAATPTPVPVAALVPATDAPVPLVVESVAAPAPLAAAPAAPAPVVAPASVAVAVALAEEEAK